jgi:hypothetical protein
LAVWNADSTANPHIEAHTSLWGQEDIDNTRPLQLTSGQYYTPAVGNGPNTTPSTFTNATPAPNAVVNLQTAYTTLTGFGAQTNPCCLYNLTTATSYEVVEDNVAANKFECKPLNGESLLMWRSIHSPVGNGQAATNIDSFQTLTMINAMKNQCAGVIKQGQAVIYQVTDTTYNLPVGYIKQYWEGFFTTGPTNAITTGSFDGYRVTPFSLVDRSTILPANTTMVQNMLLVNATKKGSANLDALAAKVAALLSPDTTDGVRRSRAAGSRGQRASDLDPGSVSSRH